MWKCHGIRQLSGKLEEIDQKSGKCHGKLVIVNLTFGSTLVLCMRVYYTVKYDFATLVGVPQSAVEILRIFTVPGKRFTYVTIYSLLHRTAAAVSICLCCLSNT